MTESLKRCGSKILHFRVNIFLLYLVAAVKVFDSIFGSTQQQFVVRFLVSASPALAGSYPSRLYSYSPDTSPLYRRQPSSLHSRLRTVQRRWSV